MDLIRHVRLIWQRLSTASAYSARPQGTAAAARRVEGKTGEREGVSEGGGEAGIGHTSVGKRAASIGRATGNGALRRIERILHLALTATRGSSAPACEGPLRATRGLVKLTRCPCVDGDDSVSKSIASASLPQTSACDQPFLMLDGVRIE